MQEVTNRNRRVRFDDSPAVRNAVFDAVTAWFHSHGYYSSEGIMQADKPQETAAVVLGEIADLIGFDVKHTEDDEPLPEATARFETM